MQARHGIVVPEALVYFYTRRNIFGAVMECYPTNNSLGELMCFLRVCASDCVVHVIVYTPSMIYGAQQ